MDEIEFVHLDEIDEEKIIDLMNNEMVRKQLPLLIDRFTPESCQAFLKAKKRLWSEHGFGPWALLINGDFAGWGGLQAEHGEADFALVLHPDFWGWGRRIFLKIKDQAFSQMKLNAITVLLPPSRPNSRAITRLGFTEEGQVSIDGEIFWRFRLDNSEAST